MNRGWIAFASPTTGNYAASRGNNLHATGVRWQKFQPGDKRRARTMKPKSCLIFCRN
jgi:hypothetical protein